MCVKTFITAFREFRLQALCLGNARTTPMNVLLGNKYPQCPLILVRCQTGCDASMIITRTPRTVTCVTTETRKNVLKPQGSPLCKLNCHVPHAGSRIFCLIPSTLCASKGPSVNFLCICSTFHQLLSTLCASARPSINFTCICKAFHQLSVPLLDLP